MANYGGYDMDAGGSYDSPYDGLGGYGYGQSQRPKKPKEDWLNNGLVDGAQTALSFAGMVPGVGEFADLANAGISAARGDWGGAGWSLLSALPGVGNLANLFKGSKAAKVANGARRLAGE